MTLFAVRLEAVEPVPHLVGLAVRAERLGAVAVLVGDGSGRGDVHVVAAAMAVATERVALLPLSTATSAAAVRRAAPALASLADLSDDRVVGCFPAAALRAPLDLGVPLAAVVRRGPAPAVSGVVGVVVESDRPVPSATGWTIWSPATVPDGAPPGGVRAGVDAVAHRLLRHDVEELDAVAGRWAQPGFSQSVQWTSSTSSPARNAVSQSTNRSPSTSSS